MVEKNLILSIINATVDALSRHEAEINRLNVFPVPDGDTGTNMLQTMQSVAAEVAKIRSNSFKDILNAITYGSLMGARGNSGVILSQIIKGICEELLSYDNITPEAVISAVKNGSKAAYQSVAKPVEGTMLTVIKDMANAADKLSGKNAQFAGLFKYIIDEGRKSVERTPVLLPILKEAGVVDAGGYGLVRIAQGILLAFSGDSVDIHISSKPANINIIEDSIDYAYCTEFVLKSNGIDMKALENELDSLGDSLLVVGTSEITKIHVHTNDPGKALQIATGLGTINNIQINNIIEQSEERSQALKEMSLMESNAGIGVVAVANGDGIKDILLSLGVDIIVNGGQSMNPSTSDILEAINNAQGKEVIVLPNNKNIIMSSQQAAGLTEKKVAVVPTRSIPEAFSALLSFDKDAPLDDNLSSMIESISKVVTGEITYAVRNGNNDLFAINDFIGLFNDEISVYGKDLLPTTIDLLDKMIDEETSTLTVLSGDQVSKEEIAKLEEMIENKYSDIELDIHSGGQPVYHFIIGAE